jgi:hypothetical protein
MCAFNRRLDQLIVDRKVPPVGSALVVFLLGASSRVELKRAINLAYIRLKISDSGARLAYFLAGLLACAASCGNCQNVMFG